jgi:hypothetical protein
MLSPSVAVAPTSPWADAEKDAVIEVARTVIADRRAAIGCIAVVAVLTDGLDANADIELSIRLRCEEDARQYDCCNNKSFDCTHNFDLAPSIGTGREVV